MLWAVDEAEQSFYCWYICLCCACMPLLRVCVCLFLALWCETFKSVR